MIRNILKLMPTIVSLIFGIILLQDKNYIFGGILTFLGTYPIAHLFSVKFSKGFKSIFKSNMFRI